MWVWGNIQIEEKRFAHRRGSDSTSASRPVSSILNSPHLAFTQPSDTLSDAGASVAGSFKLPSIMDRSPSHAFKELPREDHPAETHTEANISINIGA